MIYHEWIDFANTTVDWFATDSQEAYNFNLKNRYQDLEDAGWVDQSIDYSFNSLGFRDDEFPTNLNYLAVGCSHTQGVGLHREQTWVSQLSNMIGEKVFNAGISGAAQDTVYRVLDQLLPNYHPKVVFMLAPPSWRMELSDDNQTFKVYNFHSYAEDRSKHLDFYFQNDINSSINSQRNIDAIQNICNKWNSKLITLLSDHDLITDERARDLMHSSPDAQKDVANKFKELL